MLLANFVLISAITLILGTLALTRLPLATRQRLLSSGLPGYTFHAPGKDLTIKGAEDLPDSIRLSSLEMLHASGRARLILRCTAPTPMCEPDHVLPRWSDALMLGVLEATGAHVILLEVFEQDSHALIAQTMMTSDGLGWTGDRFDQVRQTTHLLTHHKSNEGRSIFRRA